ncbi:MAG TPA: YicC/YloC family endoribonuclease [Bacillota bacterium]|nr:YicC/YloC family endoribonuclease [Bacillota bacterium]
MIRSMTGYGQAMVETDSYRILVEMKSVNHRFLEISVRIPREQLFLEDPVKKKIGEWVKRGKIDVYVTFERKEGQHKNITLDWSLVDQYVQFMHNLKDRYSIFQESPRFVDVLNLPEVIQVEENDQVPNNQQELLLQTVDSACQQLLHMRKSEGKVLLEDLSGRIAQISRIVEEIRHRAPLVSNFYRERLLQRMNELIPGEMEDTRFLTEVALFAEKANIDEELVRLGSHCQQFLCIVESEEAIGRKLDFLVQEMNREANTIGSKANDIEISQKVVDLKAELEKIKEQVQNIE